MSGLFTAKDLLSEGGQSIVWGCLLSRDGREGEKGRKGMGKGKGERQGRGGMELERERRLASHTIFRPWKTLSKLSWKQDKRYEIRATHDGETDRDDELKNSWYTAVFPSSQRQCSELELVCTWHGTVHSPLQFTCPAGAARWCADGLLRSQSQDHRGFCRYPSCTSSRLLWSRRCQVR